MLLCYRIFKNESQNRYYKNDPHKSAYFSSIDKVGFMLYFKPSIELIEKEIIFLYNIPSIFEYPWSIAVINTFDELDDFDTDINEFVLINT